MRAGWVPATPHQIGSQQPWPVFRITGVFGLGDILSRAIFGLWLVFSLRHRLSAKKHLLERHCNQVCTSIPKETKTNCSFANLLADLESQAFWRSTCGKISFIFLILLLHAHFKVNIKHTERAKVRKMKKNLDNLKLKSPKNVMDYVASYLLSEIKCIVLKNCLLRNDWPPFCRVSRSVPRVRHSTHPRTRQGIHAIYQKKERDVSVNKNKILKKSKIKTKLNFDFLTDFQPCSFLSHF